MCKNVSKDYRGYVNQIPYKLLERLILHTPPKGVTGGVIVSLARLYDSGGAEVRRNGWGCDINPECKEYWSDLE